MVAGTLWDSVVAKMNFAWDGGSFQSLQQRIERVDGDHVDFVYDYDLVGRAYRGILNILVNFPNVIYRSVGSPVDFLHVHADTAAAISLQDVQALHGLVCLAVPPEQLRVLARIRATVVLPTPRTPQKRKCMGHTSREKEFESVWITWS